MCGVVIFTLIHFFLLVLFFRSSLYKALDGELLDLAMLRVSEVYKDFPPSLAPLVTTMGMSADVPLVQSAFGAVQAGSVLSFQHKPPAMREVINIPSAPASPSVLISSLISFNQFSEFRCYSSLLQIYTISELIYCSC